MLARGPRLAQEVRAAGGNPLYVRELADALVREGKVAVDAGVAELAAPPSRVPALLRVMIAERLSALPEETVTALRWATLLGPEFRLTDLELVTGRSIADLPGVLGAAVAGGVVTEAGGKLAFRHALIRRQLYEGVPPARLLHSQAARALAEAGAPKEQVAAQLALAPDQAAEWVREWLAGALPVLAYRMPQVTGNCCGASSRSCRTATPGGSRCRRASSRWRSCSAGTTRCSRPDAGCWPAAGARTGPRRSPG